MQFEEVIFTLESERHFWDWDREKLEREMPELFALIGREQRADYHPEGDAFVHTLLVIDKAKQITSDKMVWFGALCHDFGKAVTVQIKPGSHHDHEKLGVPIVESFCERIGAPKEFTTFAKILCEDHLNVHRFAQLRPVKKFRLLSRLGRHTLEVVTACLCDARGRGPQFENVRYQPFNDLPKARFLINRWLGKNPEDITEPKDIQVAIGILKREFSK